MSMNFTNPFYTPPNLPITPASELMSRYNTPILQQSPSIDENIALAEQVNALYSQPRPQRQPEMATRDSFNPLVNGLKDLQEMGTGLTYMFSHPKEIAGSLGNWVKDTWGAENYYKNNGNLLKMGAQPLRDIADLMLSNYDVKVDDIVDVATGKQSAKNVGARFVYNAVTHPVLTALDVAPIVGSMSKTAKAAGLGQKGVKAAKKIEDAINTEAAKVKGQYFKLEEDLKPFQNATVDDGIEAIKARETGAILPEGNAKELAKVLAKAEERYNEIIPEYAKVDRFEAATNQKALREGIASSVTDADKQLRPYYDMLKEEDGISKLAKLADEGNPLAVRVLDSKALYDEGLLGLVPHGLAEVIKDEAGKALTRDERLFAGRFSTRVFGNAKYEDILEQLTKPDKWFGDEARAFIEGSLVDEMFTKGTIGGRALVDDTTKAVKYIDPSDTRKAESVLNQATDTPKSANSIAVDADILKELRDQLKIGVGGGNPFQEGSFLSDAFKLRKGTILGSGGYLFGNLYTGAMNSLLNAGLNPAGVIQDFAEAVASKGNLAKQAGIYRKMAPLDTNAIKNPVMKGIAWANKPFAEVMSIADTHMQNLFSEMALHRRMRQEGISMGNRYNAIPDLDKAKLANIIRDVKHVSLINPTKTILPKYFHSTAAAVSPFWRWMDTAAQSGAYMVTAHPVASNMLLNKFAVDIGLDKELQNRTNLNVRSDRPFVSYRYNPKTKRVQEISGEFIPQMNTIKLVGEFGEAVRKGKMEDAMMNVALPAIPVITPIALAVAGKDKYGKPLLRPEVDNHYKRATMYIQGDKRYQFIPRVGYKEVTFQGDELLNAALGELLVAPRTFNRTVAPAAVGAYNAMTGSNLRYYQPYPNQLIGEVGQGGVMPIHANPRRSYAGEDVADMAKGLYVRDYDNKYEIERPLSRNAIRNLIKGSARRAGGTNVILNRYGGQE